MTRTLSLRTQDLQPTLHQFQKHGIGFDNLWTTMLKHVEHDTQSNYPFYNIVKQTEDSFYIEMAVAGFSENEITIEVENRLLIISGSKTEESVDVEYVHRGLSSRPFQREFTLADHVEVTSATVLNGIMKINLTRQIPEEKKRKSIKLNFLQ
jgi:molecular chaperone IbpA